MSIYFNYSNNDPLPRFLGISKEGRDNSSQILQYSFFIGYQSIDIIYGKNI